MDNERLSEKIAKMEARHPFGHRRVKRRAPSSQAPRARAQELRCLSGMPGLGPEPRKRYKGIRASKARGPRPMRENRTHSRTNRPYRRSIACGQPSALPCTPSIKGLSRPLKPSRRRLTAAPSIKGAFLPPDTNMTVSWRSTLRGLDASANPC